MKPDLTCIKKMQSDPRRGGNTSLKRVDYPLPGSKQNRKRAPSGAFFLFVFVHQAQTVVYFELVML